MAVGPGPELSGLALDVSAALQEGSRRTGARVGGYRVLREGEGVVLLSLPSELARAHAIIIFDDAGYDASVPELQAYSIGVSGYLLSVEPMI